MHLVSPRYLYCFEKERKKQTLTFGSKLESKASGTAQRCFHERERGAVLGGACFPRAETKGLERLRRECVCLCTFVFVNMRERWSGKREVRFVKQTSVFNFFVGGIAINLLSYSAHVSPAKPPRRTVRALGSLARSLLASSGWRSLASGSAKLGMLNLERGFG